MRIPYSWLREVVSAGAPGWDVTPHDLEQALVRIGHEVEDVISLGPVDGPLDGGASGGNRGAQRIQEADPRLQG